MKTPLFLFIVALFVRLAVVAIWQFDGLYGQDAFAYFQQAVAITERLPQGRLPPTDFFWPNGFPLLAALVMLALGKSVLAAQFVNLLCGAALAPLVYGLSRELFPARGYTVGIVSGLVIAIAGQPILSSVVIMADMLALFWATLAAWLLVCAWRKPGQRWWLLGAGAALSLAVITRWIYVLLIPAFAAYTLYQMHRHRSPWWYVLLPVLIGASVILPQLWLSRNRPEGLLHSWLLGWSPGNAFRRQFDNIDGHFVYRVPVGIFYAEPAGHPAYLFPLLGLTVPWGIWRLWQERNWGPLILLLGWGGPVYLFLAGIPYQNFRFGLTLYLPLVLLAGFGLSDLRNCPPLQKIAQAAVVFSLLGMLTWAYPMLNRFLTKATESKEIACRVAQAVPPEATLLTFGLTLTVRHYTSVHTQELFYFDASSLDALTVSQAPLYLLLDVSNADSQWRGRPPEVNYRWLKDHTILTQIRDFPPYTLFLVQRATGSGRER